jgi:hypothetical protein
MAPTPCEPTRRPGSIAFFTANGLCSDLCHWTFRGIGDAGPPGDVKVGPTVDDRWLGSAPTSPTSSAATPVTIDGYAGQELGFSCRTIRSPAVIRTIPTIRTAMRSCSPGRAFTPRGPANRWHLYILDVDGARLISDPLVREDASKRPRSARSIIETLDINPVAS